MTLRDVLRALPVLAGPLPAFDPAPTPDHPDDLFADWLAAAVAAGVAEPHAMVLSTVDADGVPDARVLILKDVDARGWQFAADAGSAKGRQIAANPSAALTLYWREQGRQVRARGPVTPLDRATSERDFRARPRDSRIAGLPGRQSAILASPADLDEARTTAASTLDRAPDTVPPHHTVYAVQPRTVEFWQGTPTRRHIRLRYTHTSHGWTQHLLWP
ncbi:pyridoxamine 5'-phosphate oxidase [Pilimelia anulata]|uniref:Pyridoxamine 5'-phosphate oxidase n=1 Tax=Pilimelia anulata TaxID=53371 RepID=A0A8J3B428_9ACTN|nr:pyridoxal 5'-phosphate synthase [Pilimelia anulata]GGJ94164.1 pyridoxamine 5'-phosphate oxidase [Pilimelia anulata]